MIKFQKSNYFLKIYKNQGNNVPPK